MKSYDIYFSCAMTGQAEDVRVLNTRIGRLVRHWGMENGYSVYDPEEREALGGYSSPTELFKDQIRVIENAKLVVMFLDGQSTGAGGEAVAAYYADIPIILISRNCKELSQFLLGNSSTRKTISFTSEEDLLPLLSEALLEVLKNGKAERRAEEIFTASLQTEESLGSLVNNLRSAGVDATIVGGVIEQRIQHTSKICIPIPPKETI